MVERMSKFVKQSELGKHISKLQGDKNDTAFALSVGITRQALRSIRTGEYVPNSPTRAKLGLELTYRVIDPVKPAAPSEAVPAKKAAKKTAKKPAVL